MWKELLKRLISKPKYEYKIFEYRKKGEDTVLTDQLSALGEDNWNVSAILENTHVNFKALLVREI